MDENVYKALIAWAQGSYSILHVSAKKHQADIDEVYRLHGLILLEYAALKTVTGACGIPPVGVFKFFVQRVEQMNDEQ